MESTNIEWCENTDETGSPLTEVEINDAIKYIKKYAKRKTVFCGKGRPRLYRWLKVNLQNCYIKEHTMDGGIVYYVIGHDKAAVKDYMALI